jgi:hypothetical protein
MWCCCDVSCHIQLYDSENLQILTDPRQQTDKLTDQDHRRPSRDLSKIPIKVVTDIAMRSLADKLSPSLGAAWAGAHMAARKAPAVVTDEPVEFEK